MAKFNRQRAWDKHLGIQKNDVNRARLLKEQRMIELLTGETQRVPDVISIHSVWEDLVLDFNLMGVDPPTRTDHMSDALHTLLSTKFKGI